LIVSSLALSLDEAVSAYSFLRSVVNSLFDVILGGGVEFAESSQKECLLLVVGEHKSLDGLGGMGGSLLDGSGGDISSLGTISVLGDGGGLVNGFMSNIELVNLSECLILLGLGLLDVESELVALSRLVVVSSKVHSIRVEALSSLLSALGLDFGGRKTLGQ
jgi:hypothetical protein